VWIETDENNEKYLLIKWEKEWETIVQVEDAQGNVKTVRVTVGAGATQPTPENPEKPWEETPEPNPNDDLDVEALIEDWLKQIENESRTDGIQTNNVKTLEEYKKEIDTFIQELRNKKVNQEKIDILIVRIQTIKTKISDSKVSTLQMLVQVLDYFAIELQDIYQVEIIKSDYTPEVEDGYIWWFYFKIENQEKVKEAWIEYYSNKEYSKQWFTWKKQILESRWWGEYAAFIFPKTKYTNIRWYVVDKEGNKFYTSTQGDIIKSWISLNDYYNLESGQTIASADWVQINAIPLLIPILIMGWIATYSSYECGKYNAVNGTYDDLSCYVWWWIVVAWVGLWATLSAPAIVSWASTLQWYAGMSGLSIMVTSFASKFKLQNFSNITKINLDKLSTVWQSYARTRDFISTKLNWWVWFVADKSSTAFYHLKKLLWTKSNWEWHHIVEQHINNISRFWMKNVQNTKNVIHLPKEFHSKVTGYYNSIDRVLASKYGFPVNTKVRDIIKTLDFNKQYNFWMEVLKKFWGDKFIK